MSFNLPSAELAYLAGFFDGEGCVTISRPQNSKVQGRMYAQSLRISATNTDPRPIERFIAAFGGLKQVKSYTSQRYRKKDGTPFSAAYVWIATGTPAAQILRSLLPFLLVKKAQAELGASFEEFRVEAYAKFRKQRHPDWVWQEKERFREQMCALNRRVQFSRWNPQTRRPPQGKVNRSLRAQRVDNPTDRNPLLH